MSPGRVQPAKMESLVRTPEQTKLRSTRSCSLGIVVGSFVVALQKGGRAVEQRSTGVRGVSRAVLGKRGRTHEDVVLHAVYLVCASVRHLFDGGAQGVARGGQRRWRGLLTPSISSVSCEASLRFSGVADPIEFCVIFSQQTRQKKKSPYSRGRPTLAKLSLASTIFGQHPAQVWPDFAFKVSGEWWWWGFGVPK